MNSGGAFRPAGVVLAGGRASRLGVPSKALAELRGETLIERVLQRLAPQADPVLVSVQDEFSGLESLGYPLVADIAVRHRGPLTGLASAMRHLDDQGCEWLLMCPCDAPFLPADLAARLGNAALDEHRPVAVASYQGELQPAFSLWHRTVFAEVTAAVLEQGRGGLKQMLRELAHSEVGWESHSVPPFFNVNTPADLARGGQLLDRGSG